MKKPILSLVLLLGLAVLFACPALAGLPDPGRIPLITLAPSEVAAPERIAALREQNAAGGGLVAAGFERTLPALMVVDFAAPVSQNLPASFADGLLFQRDDGSVVWAVKFGVERAYAVSVHLKSVSVPEGSRLSVLAPGIGTPAYFDMANYGPEGDLWSPTVRGPYVLLQLEFAPGASPSGYFEVAGIADIVQPERSGAPAPPAPESTQSPLALPSPANLTALVTGSNTILLQWQYSSTKGSGFKIQRRNGTSGSWAMLAKVSLGTLAYTDNSVTPCQQYSYRVKTYNSTGASPPSNEVVITAGTPGAFTLTGTAECNGNNPQNRLMWTASIAATSYDIYRNGVLLASSQAGPPYLDGAVTAGQNYGYKVTAKNACTVTMDSNTVSVTALSNCCPLPGDFTVTATASCSGGSPQIVLNWTASSNATSYNVWRNGVVYATGITATTYTDTTVSAGTSYNYRIVAKNVCGDKNSNTDTATAGTPPGAFTVTVNPDCFGSPAVPAFRIQWTAASGVTSSSSYDIYRDGTLLAANKSQLIIWYDINVAAGSTHSYFVRAKNSCGNTDSNTASGVAPATCTYSIIVDDLDAGFHKYGPAGWWYEINNSVCYNGHMWYTPNETTPPSANYAYWYANLAVGGAGNYKIYTYIPCLYGATTSHATYYVYHGGSLTATAVVDQLIGCNDWHLMGTYACYGDGNDIIGLGDATGEANLSTNVGFDAIMWQKLP